MEKFVYYNLLFDIYGDLLTVKEQEYFSLYYEENLTLQEIDDNFKVSKSYIGNMIKKIEIKLNDLESKLHILEKRNNLEKLLKVDDISQIHTEINKIIFM